MHHRLPIKLFILNNGGYLTIKQTQELGFEGRLMGVTEETGLSFPDMMMIAAAHRIPAVRLQTQERLRERVQEVLDQEGPGICEVMMDPNQAQVPKAVNRRLADGTIQQTPLEDLYPFLDREELQANMIAERKE
jgi:acetolactate synthase-1/2/3 large subunit